MLIDKIKFILIIGIFSIFWIFPGEVIIKMLNYTLETSVAVAVFSIMLFFIVLLLLGQLINNFLNFKHWFWELFASKLTANKIKRLEYFITAIANNNRRDAQKQLSFLQKIDPHLAPALQINMANILPAKEKINAIAPFIEDNQFCKRAITILMHNTEECGLVVQHYCQEYINKHGFDMEVFAYLIKNNLEQKRYKQFFTLVEKYQDKSKELFTCACYLLACQSIKETQYKEAAIYIDKGLKKDSKHIALNILGFYVALTRNKADSALKFVNNGCKYPFWLLKQYYDLTNNYHFQSACIDVNLASAYVFYLKGEYDQAMELLRTVEDPFKNILISLCNIKNSCNLTNLEKELTNFLFFNKVTLYDSLYTLNLSPECIIQITQPVLLVC